MWILRVFKSLFFLFFFWQYFFFVLSTRNDGSTKILSSWSSLTYKSSYIVGPVSGDRGFDVKSAFLNCVIFEEVYVKQPLGFEDLKHPNYVFKLKKSLYGLRVNNVLRHEICHFWFRFRPRNFFLSKMTHLTVHIWWRHTLSHFLFLFCDALTV